VSQRCDTETCVYHGDDNAKRCSCHRAVTDISCVYTKVYVPQRCDKHVYLSQRCEKDVCLPQRRDKKVYTSQRCDTETFVYHDGGDDAKGVAVTDR